MRLSSVNLFKPKPELGAVRVTRITWAWIRTWIWTWVWWAWDNSWCCQNWRLVTWLHAERLLLRGNWTWICSWSWVIFGKPVINFIFISFNLIHSIKCIYCSNHVSGLNSRSQRRTNSSYWAAHGYGPSHSANLFSLRCQKNPNDPN